MGAAAITTVLTHADAGVADSVMPTLPIWEDAVHVSTAAHVDRTT